MFQENSSYLPKKKTVIVESLTAETDWMSNADNYGSMGLKQVRKKGTGKTDGFKLKAEAPIKIKWYEND